MKMSLNQRFQQDGVIVMQQVLAPQQAHAYKNAVESRIKDCAKELNVSTSLYLSAVSRWADPSPITSHLNDLINEQLKPLFEDFFFTDLVLSKFNIICKSPYARDYIPCHQDIAYSKEMPYEFSAWLALTDVDDFDGPIEVLPGSHLGKIAPAVDFWNPYFEDTMRKSEIWSQQKISYPVSKGDAILFDSRVWHGSAMNTSDKIRIALVTRWKSEKFRGFYQNIPEKEPADFGMWTCGVRTFEFLKRFMNRDQSEYCSDFILEVINRIKMRKDDIGINTDRAVSALTRLAILHQANNIHNGGDALGNVYSDVWNHFLYPLIRAEII